MSQDKKELDLIVLVADADAEWTLRTLLSQRKQALGIRSDLRFKVIRHPSRDSGVAHHAAALLRRYLRRAEHALVLFDREGSGFEHKYSAVEIEDQVEATLHRNGWPRERCAVIVLDPELEVWVWSSSPHVAKVIGLSPTQLQTFLAPLPRDERGKPQRPKEVLLEALRQSGRPFSSRLFQDLAARVSLRSEERAFGKLRQTLQNWFGR